MQGHGIEERRKGKGHRRGKGGASGRTKVKETELERAREAGKEGQEETEGLLEASVGSRSGAMCSVSSCSNLRPVGPRSGAGFVLRTLSFPRLFLFFDGERPGAASEERKREMVHVHASHDAAENPPAFTETRGIRGLRNFHPLRRLVSCLKTESTMRVRYRSTVLAPGINQSAARACCVCFLIVERGMRCSRKSSDSMEIV